jgi:alkanesulfonate monooxygenase SsuD/methylene tetrahydromethanopterin reductase-like flavin-dependent oxidoreductase (luciferase family)
MLLSLGILIMPRPPLAGIIERCRRYESLGFESVWLCDHFVDQQYGPLYESWTLLAALAAATSRIRLGAAATCLPYRQPAVLVKSATTVDHISSGRLEMGMGSGWWRPEFDRFGYEFPSPAERVRRFTETVAALPKLFAELSPPPVQRPYPPLILAAQGPKMLETVAAHGDGWLASFGLSSAEISVRNHLLDDRCAADGRPPAALRRIFLWTPWVQEVNPWASVVAFQDFVGEYRAVGVTEIILEEPAPEQAGVFQQIAQTFRHSKG